MKRGTLFVISAPSGAGKSTLISAVRKLFPDLQYSISCTTRLPRENEIPGIDYCFIDKNQFLEMIQNNKFLEWKEVHGNLYGTPTDPVMEALAKGCRIVLDIDVQGAQDVFQRINDAVGIFIDVADFNVLEERLRARGADSEQSIKTRIDNARCEVALAGTFRHRVINDRLDEAIHRLAEIISSESR